jgi:hypothetical protein
LNFVRQRRLAILLVLVAIPIALVAWQYLALRSYHHFILSTYSAEIEQLANAMHEWPRVELTDEASYRRTESLREELTATFHAGDFYCAGWSFDSHHGATGTGLPDGGFSTCLWLSTSDSKRQSLSYGKTFGGEPLLVYQRWIPDAPVMKHIRIVWYRDKVDKRRASKPAS